MRLAQRVSSRLHMCAAVGYTEGRAHDGRRRRRPSAKRKSKAQPDLAEFIGGPLTSSMSHMNRVELIMHIMPGIPRLTVHALFSETLDAVIYLGTGIQPSTTLKSICDSLQQLGDLCMREYTERCCEDIGLTRKLLGLVASCSGQSCQADMVSIASEYGFCPFDAASFAG